jgi:hypothetical protein
MRHIWVNHEYWSQVGSTNRRENIVNRYVSFVSLLSICKYVLLDEISNVPPDGKASGPDAAGETPLCSDQDTARSESSNQAHMQLCWSSTQNKFVLIC